VARSLFTAVSYRNPLGGHVAVSDGSFRPIGQNAIGLANPNLGLSRPVPLVLDSMDESRLQQGPPAHTPVRAIIAGARDIAIPERKINRRKDLLFWLTKWVEREAT
jgi:hypothetical protein